MTASIISDGSSNPYRLSLANLAGKNKAINFDGRALVQFDGPDQGWHDIDLICLRVVPQSAPLGDGPDLRG